MSLISSSGKWKNLLSLGLFLLSACAGKTEPIVKRPSTLEHRPRIAVLPVENLSGTAAPLKEMGQIFIRRLEEQGIEVLAPNALEDMMARHRIRYTGGIDRETAQAFRDEAGTEGVLITSLELYSNLIPPKIALTSRLVETGPDPTIRWIEAVGLAGDDSPGILGLGLVEEMPPILDKALQALSDSLFAHLSGQRSGRVPQRERRFEPKIWYQSPTLDPGKEYRLAVLPFVNLSDRKYAGEIMRLHFVRHLVTSGNYNVIEPGVVRQELLTSRMIMEEGLSLAQADVMFSGLDAGLLLMGKVIDYQDFQGAFGNPKVDFSVQLIERKDREVVWSSNSHNQGDVLVSIFDWGRLRTAHVMASKMVQSICQMWEEPPRQARRR